MNHVNIIGKVVSVSHMPDKGLFIIVKTKEMGLTDGGEIETRMQQHRILIPEGRFSSAFQFVKEGVDVALEGNLREEVISPVFAAVYCVVVNDLIIL